MAKIIKIDLEHKGLIESDTPSLPTTLEFDGYSIVQASINDTSLTIENFNDAGQASAHVDNSLEIDKDGYQASVAIFDGGTNKPAYMLMHADDGTAFYLFIEPDGTFRLTNSLPTSNADGVVIGEQV